MLTPDEIAKLIPAERAKFRSPIPTQSVSSDEFFPAAQTPRQREFEARIKRLGSELARALQSTELRQSFAGEGAEPEARSAEAFQRFVSNEINRWRKVAQETGIKPE